MALKDEMKNQGISKPDAVKRPRARVSITGRNVLTIREEDKDPNFFYRVVNDQGDRVELLKERGYEVVTDAIRVGDRRVATPTAEGSPVQVHVGGGMKGIVMRIPKEFKEEDDAVKQGYVDSLEASMRKQSASDYGSVKISKG